MVEGPAHIRSTRAHRIVGSRPNAAQIITFVGVEILVFGADERLFDHRWDRLSRCEKPAFLRELINDPAFARIYSADRGRLILRKAFMAGQVAPIHPEHRPHGQRYHRRTHSDGGENPTEEGQNEPKHDRSHLF